MQKIIVNSTENIRIDNYLKNELDMTRAKVQNIISSGSVLVNGKVVKNNYLIKNNDVIEITEIEQEIKRVEKENIPLDIVYEDDEILVINKPSGMVVHPGAGNREHTLVNALMYYTKDLSSENGTDRPGIVHRIDADTSGLLLVAKTNKAHLFLANQLKDKTMNRTYIALVSGIINENTGTIDAPIGRDERNRKRMAVTSNNSKSAITHFKVLERYKNATLIECKLETGRTHQIRVHMKYIKHPITNDNVYGEKIKDNTYGQMLHASELEFIHPSTKEKMKLECSLPEEFTNILNLYKNGINSLVNKQREIKGLRRYGKKKRNEK